MRAEIVNIYYNTPLGADSTFGAPPLSVFKFPSLIVFSLYRYGNDVCFLDATYKTTRYALPLFFLAVKTNVGYSVVAEFVVEVESTAAILIGLKTVKTWMEEENLCWQPTSFMTDFDEREICAIEQLFPGLLS